MEQSERFKTIKEFINNYKLNKKKIEIEELKLEIEKAELENELKRVRESVGEELKKDMKEK